MSAVQSISLKFSDPQARRLMVGLAWEPNTAQDPLFGEKNQAHDLDLSCAVISAAGDVLDVITPQDRKQSKYKFQIFHKGDNQSGGSDFEDEQIILNLDKMDEKIDRIVFLLSTKSDILFHEVNNPECSFYDYQSDNKFLSFGLSGLSQDKNMGNVMFLSDHYVLGLIEKEQGGQWRLHPAYSPEIEKASEDFKSALEGVLAA